MLGVLRRWLDYVAGQLRPSLKETRETRAPPAAQPAARPSELAQVIEKPEEVPARDGGDDAGEAHYRVKRIGMRVDDHPCGFSISWAISPRRKSGRLCTPSVVLANSGRTFLVGLPPQPLVVLQRTRGSDDGSSKIVRLLFLPCGNERYQLLPTLDYRIPAACVQVSWFTLQALVDNGFESCGLDAGFWKPLLPVEPECAGRMLLESAMTVRVGRLSRISDLALAVRRMRAQLFADADGQAFAFALRVAGAGVYEIGRQRYTGLKALVRAFQRQFGSWPFEVHLGHDEIEVPNKVRRMLGMPALPDGGQVTQPDQMSKLLKGILAERNGG